VTISFKRNKPHDVLVVKISSWNITETMTIASVLHGLVSYVISKIQPDKLKVAKNS